MRRKRSIGWKQIPLLVVLIFSGIPAALSEDIYSRPHYKTLPVPADGLSIESAEQEELLDALASIARDFDSVSMLEKAKAVAVSRRIAPLHKETFVTDYQLARGVNPEKLGKFETLSEASAIVFSSARKMEAASEKAEQALALHLYDLLDSVGNREEGVASGLASLKVKGLTPSWDDVFPSGAVPSGGGSLGSLEQVHRISLFSTDGIIEITATGLMGGNHTMRFATEDDLVTGYFTSAFREGLKFLEVSQAGAMRGIAISFDTNTDHEEDFFDYQGPAAALPGLVALQALIDETEIDPSVALAGDVNADGTIQPVHDILERIEGLEDNDSKIIGIPATDYPSVSDAMILDGPRFFAKHQVFTLKKFSDAVALSENEQTRDEKLQEAIEKFSIIQDVLAQPGGNQHLKHPSTINKLREVLALAPSHLSARMLGLWATNQVPTRLSLSASLDLVIEPVYDVVGGDDDDGKAKESRSAAFKTLKRMQRAIDPRLSKLTHAVIQYSNVGRVGDSQYTLLNAAKTRVRDEYDSIVRQPAIREELMR